MEIISVPQLSQINPPKTPKWRSNPLQRQRQRRSLLLLLLLLGTSFSLLTTFCESYIPNPTAVNSQIQYSKHCNHIVPEPLLDRTNFPAFPSSLRFTTAFFAGGDPLFISHQTIWPNSVAFVPHIDGKTVNSTVFKLEARLSLMISPKDDANIRFRRLRMVKFRGPRIPLRRGSASFWLSGFWSEADGKLCMVGSGSNRINSGKSDNLNVVLKLNYSRKSNLSVFDSLVSGVLESLDFEGRESYFKPVSILGVAKLEERPYEFTLIDKGNESDFEDGLDRDKSLSVSDADQGVCSVFGFGNFKFELAFNSVCYRGGNVSCSPVTENVDYLPSALLLRKIRCVEKQKMVMLLGFLNSSIIRATFPFDPKTTLIAEGVWDDEKNQLHGVACRILNFTQIVTNAYVGDCSVRFNLRFPTVFSVRNRSTILGQIWSNKSEHDPGYFDKIGFQSSPEVLMGLSGFKYRYTVVDVARKSCAIKNNVKHKGKTYPDVNSVDMRFS
ncbi:hypothetical protein CICLE_v100142821mg, partial [Citrus x clementina]